MTHTADKPALTAPFGVFDIRALVAGEATLDGLSASTRSRNERGRAALLEQLERDGVVYGVTTGFGDSCETRVQGELVVELPRNLYRFHGCGLGEPFSPDETRAILLARLSSLATGYSAVRPVVLEHLAKFFELDLLPLIPSLGSVGASGDLTPLSYIAAALAGEGEALYRGTRMTASQALEAASLTPLTLEPKESLALMNGTSAMGGVAALCLPRALYLTRWAAALTASNSDVMLGQARHFDPRLFEAKPHPGQALVARWIRDDIEFERDRTKEPARVQDRYSIRCAPHVLGVLLDFFPTLNQLLDVELMGANDNPLVDPDSGDVLHGGNFYGGHVCAAMDLLKTQVANIADLLDRQLALLCNETTNHGLPINLVGAPGATASAHHGFKAMQITTSALAAEAAKLTMPASVFSRSTENHNQDKVSMGTIAARDCVRVLELTEYVAAIVTLATAQAHDLRGGVGCHRRSAALHAQLRTAIPMHTADRPMQADILRVLDWAQSGQLPIGALDLPPGYPAPAR
ncbi:MAG TPA: aromatic amino acid ammonia-lyase [Polyangiaceae bacterium]|nr:aromatic amino acid ammonia-lyase [Polyangiaceae bacterium]